MKKFGLLLMPLMAISLLASCNSAHEHAFSSEWSTNESSHWHAATCEHKDISKDLGNHTYGEDNKCTVCGYPKPINYNVSFDSDGGTFIDAVTVVNGQKCPKPTDPKKELDGYVFTFGGWYLGNDLFNFETTPITSSITLKAKWTDTRKERCLVSFNPAGGSYVDPQVVIVGETANPVETTKEGFTFDGWYLTVDYTGNAFDFSTPIDKDMVLHAKWNQNPGTAYTITIKDKNSRFTEQNILFIKDNFAPMYATFDIEEGYTLSSVMPEHANLTIDLVGASTIKITPQENSDSTIELETVEKPYSFYCDVEASGQRMKFFRDEAMTTPLNIIKAFKFDDFVFYMYAENESNAPQAYIPPTRLDIKADNVPILDSNYTIESVSGELQNVLKKVTIKKEALTGDITIYGDAVLTEYYHIEFPYFPGLEPITDEKTYFAYNADGVINFEAKNTTNEEELLTARNVYVSLTGNNDDYVCANNSPFLEFKHTTNPEAYTLTIKANAVDKNKTNTIKVIARSKAYPILEDFTWSQISELNKKGIASRLFIPGDMKKVTMDGLEYKTRILDFDKDRTLHNEKVITFEFTNVIKGYETDWDVRQGITTKNYDFPGSALNHCLQPGGVVYSKIPNDLKENLKTVIKLVEMTSAYVQKPYDTQLFPLSRYELDNDNPETCYEYYKGLHYSSRIKTEPNGPAREYWVRTPWKEADNKCMTIREDGRLLLGHWVFQYLAHVAPAFCI